MADGRVLENYFLRDCDDVNHAQLLDGDTRALVSCRDSDSILLYDLKTNATLWVAGGNQCPGNPEKTRGFRTLEASISVEFQSIRLLLGPLIISARVLEI